MLLGGAIGVDVLMAVSLVSFLYDALCGSANVLRGSPTWLSVASVVVIVLLLPSLVVSSLFFVVPGDAGGAAAHTGDGRLLLLERHP